MKEKVLELLNIDEISLLQHINHITCQIPELNDTFEYRIGTNDMITQDGDKPITQVMFYAKDDVTASKLLLIAYEVQEFGKRERVYDPNQIRCVITFCSEEEEGSLYLLPHPLEPYIDYMNTPKEVN